MALKKKLRQQKDVISAIAQGRNPYFRHIDAVIEIFPKVALADGFFQIGIGGGDELDIHAHGFGTAHAQDFALLQNPEQLGLIGQGHVRQLVEKQRAPRSFLNEALTRVDARGDAFFDAEHLAFKQRVGDGRAVDRYERPFAPGRVEMDRLGDDFFPSPGGAEDKRIDGPAGDGQGKLNDLPHGLALAHDLLGLVVFLNGPHQMRVALGEEPVRFLQLGVAGFQIRNELRTVVFPAFHLDQHHAEGFREPDIILWARAFLGEGKQPVLAGGAAPSQIVAKVDQGIQKRLFGERFLLHVCFLCVRHCRWRDCTQRSTSATGPMRSLGM